MGQHRGRFFPHCSGPRDRNLGLNRPDADPAKTADSLRQLDFKAEGHALRELLFAGGPHYRANVTFQSEETSSSAQHDYWGFKSVKTFYTNNSASGRDGGAWGWQDSARLTLICRLLEHRQTLDDQTRSKTSGTRPL